MEDTTHTRARARTHAHTHSCTYTDTHAHERTKTVLTITNYIAEQRSDCLSTGSFAWTESIPCSRSSPFCIVSEAAYSRPTASFARIEVMQAYHSKLSLLNIQISKLTILKHSTFTIFSTFECCQVVCVHIIQHKSVGITSPLAGALTLLYPDVASRLRGVSTLSSTRLPWEHKNKEKTSKIIFICLKC